MQNLIEALKRSMINKLEKHECVLTKFTKDDLENGDLLVDNIKHVVWLYLDSDEMQKRAKEMKNLSRSNIRDLNNKSPFIVCADTNDKYSKEFGFYRVPKHLLENQQNHITYSNKVFDTLIKCGYTYLQDNLTIEQIFIINDNFEKYLS